MQHRAPQHAPGRHRRTPALTSHRAPREPIAEKGRYAMAAALVAGVGVAGVTAAGEGASPAGAVTRSLAPSAAPTPPPAAARSATDTKTTSPTTGTASSTAAAAGTGPANGTNTGPANGTSTGSIASSARAGGTDSLVGDPAGGGSDTTVAAGSGPTNGIAGVAPIGGLDVGTPYAPQLFKIKPQPAWINPMPEGTVTSCFGERWGRLHAGVDLAAPHGTPIRAAGAGTVVSAGPADGYGNAVLIDHGNGYLTHYGHMSAITVTVGQRLKAGDQIGNEGSTGHSTGPHLHFEVHKGSYKNPIEPTRWMHDHGVDINGCVAFTG